MGFMVRDEDTAAAIRKQQELLGKATKVVEPEPEKIVITEKVEPKEEVKGIVPKKQTIIDKRGIR